MMNMSTGGDNMGIGHIVGDTIMDRSVMANFNMVAMKG
jgi:hypothetical protein